MNCYMNCYFRLLCNKIGKFVHTLRSTFAVCNVGSTGSLAADKIRINTKDNITAFKKKLI